MWRASPPIFIEAVLSSEIQFHLRSIALQPVQTPRQSLHPPPS